MQLSLFFNSCTIFMMPSELRFKKITGSWNHGGKSTRYRAWQEGFSFLEPWASGQTLLLYPFCRTNPRQTDSLLWVICCQLPEPNSTAPSVNLQLNASAPRTWLQIFGTWRHPPSPHRCRFRARQVAAAGSASPTPAPGFAVQSKSLPESPRSPPARGEGQRGPSASPSPGRPDLPPRLQKHRPRALHAVNRTEFAITSMKFYLATLGKHLWHT